LWLEPAEGILYPVLAIVFGVILFSSGYVAFRMASSLRESVEPYEE
jgi:hypothetical protein